MINYPKYLPVKMELMDGIDIDTISELRLHKRRYVLSNIIFAQDREENSKEYTVSTKLNTVWYYCDNNNNVSQLKEYLLNNAYILYFTRIDSTL
jgi:hypothetical protein